MNNGQLEAPASAPAPDPKPWSDPALEETTIDLFGRTVNERVRGPVMDELDEWKCSFCMGRYPSAFGVDIIVLAPTYMLCFCSPDCAREMNFAEAARKYDEFYRLTGNPWLIVTEDERVPDPSVPSDVELYSDAIAALGTLLIDRPSFEMIAEREAREESAIASTWTDA